jgi:hypothetical protein
VSNLGMAKSVYVVALFVLGLGSVSAQVAVPRDWQRVSVPLNPKSELVSCASQGSGALFRVTFDGPRLTSTVMKERDRRHDPAPYDLDWAAALSGRPNDPTQRQTSEWAMSYARDRAERVVVPVDDGYLIGFGAGEYGGSLWWYPREPGPGRLLAQAVVHGIVATPEPGTFIAVTGLAHLSANSGRALWVDRSDQGAWRVRREVPLQGSPQVHVAHADGILMADSSIVDLLTWNGELRTLRRSAIAALSGSFAFGPAGEIAIGRGVVVSLLTPTPTGEYREELFRPKECQQFTYWRDLICMCSGAPLPLPK